MRTRAFTCMDICVHVYKRVHVHECIPRVHQICLHACTVYSHVHVSNTQLHTRVCVFNLLLASFELRVEKKSGINEKWIERIRNKKQDK